MPGAFSHEDLGNAVNSGQAMIVDPGDDGVIPLEKCGGTCKCVVAGAEDRFLADPVGYPGFWLYVSNFDGTGEDITLKNSVGTTVATIGDGETALAHNADGASTGWTATILVLGAT